MTTPALTEAGVQDLRDWITKNGLPVDPIVVALCDYWLASAGDGWRPIETAPRDGSFVQLYWPTMSIDRYPAVAFNHGDACGWQLVSDRDYGEALPTHWRPLPAPPNTREGEAP